VQDRRRAEEEAMSKPAKRRSHKKMDPDIKALTLAARALKGSTPRMLIPNLDFLIAHFLNLSSFRLRP
jgi:hypothetical protein